ncbi:MAG: hypothetical protein ACOCZD_00635 [Haloferacaceae archaeon]
MSEDEASGGVLGTVWKRLRRPRQWARYIAVGATAFFVSLLFIVLVRPVLAPVVGRDGYGFVVLVWMLATLYAIRLYSRQVLG